MCGINGFTWKDQTLLEAMNQATRHRGPDDRGVYVDERVSLGQCRLSIIDLSPDGRQPMRNEDGSLWLVYNGEIYNFASIREELLSLGHAFSSHTDSEVILHAYESWGLDCMDRFNGMWAFCLYDAKNKKLVLARDRFGIKPMYYHVRDGRLIFSSMIAGILEHGVRTRPNDRAIMEYLAYNLLQHDSFTFFEDILMLPAGHTLTWSLDSGEHTVARWYTPSPRPLETARELRALFEQSVRFRTVSDVPVGVCLSGGIDSSAITCALDQVLPDEFQTFSMVAPGSPGDESRYIAEVAARTKAKSHTVAISPEEFTADVDDFISALEEPVLTLSVYAQYRVFKLAREHGAKVLLDGQGGDEIFAGYKYYYAYRLYELFRSFRWITLLREALAYREKLGGLLGPAFFLFLLLPGCLRRSLWRKKKIPWVNHAFLKTTCPRTRDPRVERLDVRQGLNATLLKTSIPHLLNWEDKNSMRWSIESRVPFLDVNLVESAMTLPSQSLIRNGETKRLFKEALWDLLPEMIRERKDKVGYEAPADAFFRAKPLASFAHDVFASDSFKSRPYWRADSIRDLFERHQNGSVSAAQTLWKCLHTELWLRKFFD